MFSDVTKYTLNLHPNTHIKCIGDNELNMELRTMTFPHDHLREEIRAEEHSFGSIAAVSIMMIVAAMSGLIAIF